ncbi:MAG: TSUP family transporter, partial [Candidatus Zixiibacteriota bacterium]
MIETLSYILCGVLAGLLGGYMGLGGGVILVPYMTIVLGMDIKEAVPVSMIAIVVGTLTASTPYLKKSMVDTELVIMISLFMVVG